MKNIVVITADDLSLYSLGVGGCRVKVTPNLDRLASEGFFFKNAHCNVPFCQPSRAVLLTGLYPQHNGAFGFNPINLGTPTLPSLLKRAGYCVGIIGKLGHHKPDMVFQWDYKDQPQGGRDAGLIRQSVENFLRSSKTPYFLLINIHDPHRPFAPDCGINFADIEIPPFLPDNPMMRQEFIGYYSTVKRLDDTVGNLLSVFSDALIVFTSDHGMSFPFVKGNCYYYSTNVPLIIKGEGILQKADDGHLVSHVDFVPTIMEYIGLQGSFDGVSYAQLLTKGEQQGLDYVFSQLNSMFNTPPITIRAVTSREYCYVVNVDQNYFFNCVDGWGWAECVAALPPKYLARFATRQAEELLSRLDQTTPNEETRVSLRAALVGYMVKYQDPMREKVLRIMRNTNVNS